MNIKDHRHGVVAFDCDHHACKAATLRCRKRYELNKLRGTSPFVDAEPVRLHISTLIGQGWSQRAIAGAAGVGSGSVCNILKRNQTRVRPEYAAKILAVDPHQVPSKASSQTGEPFVPRVGTVRRIQALLTLGWTYEQMNAACGCKTQAIVHQQGRWITRTTYDRVAAMYRDLCTRPGPSAITRRRAAERGYPGPADWDDIDHDEAPDLDVEDSEWSEDFIDHVMVDRIVAGEPRPRRATQAEAQAAYDRLVAAGVGVGDIERIHGLRADRYARTEDAA